MTGAQFVGGLLAVLGSNYGMSKSEHDKWIKRYGMPGAPQEDPIARQMAAWQKSQYYYGQLGSWELVGFAWSAGLSNAMTAKASGKPLSAYIAENPQASNLRAPARTAGSIVSAASTAPTTFASDALQPTYVVQTTQVNIPQAPPVDAQGQVDAYLEMLQAQQEAAAEEAARVNTHGAVTGALSQLSMIAAGGGRMSMKAPPSPTLDPEPIGEEVE